MTREDKGIILFREIRQLPVSEGFKQMAEQNGFYNLDQVLSMHLSFLMTREGFTPLIQQEFIQFLIKEELIDLLKQS